MLAELLNINMIKFDKRKRKVKNANLLIEINEQKILLDNTECSDFKAVCL